jgi:D-alanyl-D-alanine-carboxypeptidase/D-alanyl-D-alanine-endopeptidase
MLKMQLHVKCRVAACVQIIVATLAPMAYGLDLQAKIDPLARPLLEDGLVVGFVVGIVKDGQTQVIAYGETTKGSHVAPNGDTVYEIGSVSKAFTGVLLAEMVQRGIVKLDDPVQKYLPAEVKMPVAGGKPITLEHLATHTSGLPRLPDNLKPADPSNPYADYMESQMHEFLMGHELRRPPGQHEYSNYGMGLLGQVLARQLGRTYEQCLLEQICKPLGMHDTRITLNEDQYKRLASPYNGALKLENPWDIPTLAGAGGIRSTCNDMIKFIQANLTDDDKSLTQALRLSHQKRHTMKDGLAMGLGWHIARDGITRWHNGMTGGFHSWLAVVPSHKLGVVLLANTANMRLTQFGEKVTRIAFGLDVEPPKPRKVVDVSFAVLESYAGVYMLTPQFALTVTVEGGKLMVQATGQDKFQVFAESKTKFFYKVVDAQISFVPDQDGKVNHVILHQGGLNQKAARNN